MGSDPNAPLAGIRVVTVDNYEAGNYGPELLAQHGAEVIKVELPRGDPLRGLAPFTGGDEPFSHGEMRLMRGKQSVVLDPRSNPEAFKQLVARADVFWTNLRPGAARRLGVDHDSIKSLNRDVIYAALTGFGVTCDDGGEPPPDLPAFDIVIQALGGLLMRNADIDGRPTYTGAPYVDQVTSLVTFAGVLLGLLRRARTKEGAYIDVSMYDTAIALNEKALTVYGISAEVPAPRLSATSAPFGVFEAADGYVVIGVGSNEMWIRFCHAIGQSHIAKDDSLAHGDQRLRVAHTVIKTLVEDWTLGLAVAEVVTRMRAEGIPAAAVSDVPDLIHDDLAYRRGALEKLELDGHSYTVVQSPIKLVGQPLPLSKPPRLGDHYPDGHGPLTGRIT